jgi:hypothetical protein
MDAYYDDPVGLKSNPTRKKPSPIFAIIALVIGGGFFLQTTLAANISLSSNSSVEFGQGTLMSTACSGESQLTLTPTSAFTNAAGAGSYKFSSVTVSGIPDSCWGKDFTISAYDESSVTPLALFSTTSTSAVIYNNDGVFSSGIGSSGMTVASSPGTFTATFTTPVTLSSSVFRITIQSGEHTLFYNVGDRGPGGGIVYYVSASNFTSTGSTCDTTCTYLEVAPATWQGAGIANDSSFVWSTNTTVTTGQDATTSSTEGIATQSSNEKTNWKIGQGFYNTSVMKVSGATSDAQAAVLAYAGTSIAGQWFIPSTNELNELCKYARGQSTGDLTVACVTGSGTFKSTANAGTDRGGFVEATYWSSSESDPYYAWNQNFHRISQFNSGKGLTRYVRPIRAF